MYIYYPSCNFRKMFLETEKKLQNYLKTKDDIKIVGCCMYSQKFLTDNLQGIINCQACRSILNDSLDNPDLITIFEYLYHDKDFVFPNYGGMDVILQDCHRDHDQKQSKEIIKKVLEKMNCNIIAINDDEYCGLLHYNVKDEHLKQLMAASDAPKLSKMSDDIKEAAMKEHASSLPEGLVVTYCNSCTRGLKLANREVKHLLELVMA